MAERGTPTPKPLPALPPDVLPSRWLQERTEAFLTATQGPDKPEAYPAAS